MQGDRWWYHPFNTSIWPTHIPRKALAALPAPNLIAVRWPLWMGSHGVNFFSMGSSQNMFFIEPQKEVIFQNVNGWIGPLGSHPSLWVGCFFSKTKGKIFWDQKSCKFRSVLVFFGANRVLFKVLLSWLWNGTKRSLFLSRRLHHGLSEPVCVFVFNH